MGLRELFEPTQSAIESLLALIIKTSDPQKRKPAPGKTWQVQSDFLRHRAVGSKSHLKAMLAITELVVLNIVFPAGLRQPS